MGREDWRRVRGRLAEEIASGQRQPGSRLPAEPELCRAFGVGRHSVRRAMHALAADGQLIVEHGRGAFVQSAPLIRYAIGRRTRFRQNLADQGYAPAGEHIADEIVAAPATVTEALALAPGAQVHRLLRRGLADDAPISLTLSFHDAARFPDMALLRAEGRSVSDIYRDHGVADYFRKNTTVFARLPTAEEARLLRQHQDQPVMVVTKTDVDRAGGPIGYAEAVWCAGRVQFIIDTLDEDGGRDV